MNFVVNVFPLVFFTEFVFVLEFLDFFVSFEVSSRNSSHFIGMDYKKSFSFVLIQNGIQQHESP